MNRTRLFAFAVLLSFALGVLPQLEMENAFVR